MISIIDSLYLLILPLLVLGMVAVGDRLVTHRRPCSLSERLGLALASGMAVCAVAITFFGIIHLLRPLWGWLVLAVFSVDGLRWARRNGRAILCQILVFWREENRTGRALIALCILVCVVNGWFCLSPEIRHDPFDYHLTVANLYTVSGQIIEIPWHVFTYMPKYGEMLYAFVLLLGPDILGKLLHWTAGVGVLLLTFALGRRFGNRRTGLISTFLVALIPLFSFLTTTCYVDLFVALWALAAVLCLATGSGDGRWIAGAIFLGMVLGSKYVAWATVVAPVLFAILVLQRYRVSAVFQTARTLVLALLVASPWLIYNALWTGNPTYPLLHSVFGRHIPPCAAAEAFFRTHSPPWEALTLSGCVPYLVMRLGRLASNGAVVFFSGFLAALFYLFRRVRVEKNLPPESPPQAGGTGNRPVKREGRDARRFLAWTVFLSAWIFLFATGNYDGRFFFPTLALCAVLTGLLVSDLMEQVTDLGNRRTLIRGGYVIALGLALFWVPQRINQIQVFDQKIIPQISAHARERVLNERFPGFALVTWANENLPSDALVLGLGYPLRRRYISKNKYGYVKWLQDEPHLDDPARLADLLRRAGVTHIVSPWPVLQDNVDFSILFPTYLTEMKRADSRILYALKANLLQTPKGLSVSSRR